MQAVLEEEASPTAGQAAAGRRASKRDLLIVAATLWEGGEPGPGPGRRVWVYNVSQGGIAFRTNKPVNADIEHCIRFAAGPLTLDSRVRIAWCRRRDDATLEVGAEFVR